MRSLRRQIDDQLLNAKGAKNGEDIRFTFFPPGSHVFSN